MGLRHSKEMHDPDDDAPRTKSGKKVNLRSSALRIQKENWKKQQEGTAHAQKQVKQREH